MQMLHLEVTDLQPMAWSLTLTQAYDQRQGSAASGRLFLFTIERLLLEPATTLSITIKGRITSN